MLLIQRFLEFLGELQLYTRTCDLIFIFIFGKTYDYIILRIASH
jgi:hypothetical protein